MVIIIIIIIIIIIKNKKKNLNAKQTSCALTKGYRLFPEVFYFKTPVLFIWMSTKHMVLEAIGNILKTAFLSSLPMQCRFYSEYNLTVSCRQPNSDCKDKTRGGSRKFRKRGPSLPPPPLSTPLHPVSVWSRQHCGHIHDPKWSNVNVSEDRIKEHFIKRFSGRLEGLGSCENVLKKGGRRGPLGPSPKSAYENSIFSPICNGQISVHLQTVNLFCK